MTVKKARLLSARRPLALAACACCDWRTEPSFYFSLLKFKQLPVTHVKHSLKDPQVTGVQIFNHFPLAWILGFLFFTLLKEIKKILL